MDESKGQAGGVLTPVAWQFRYVFADGKKGAWSQPLDMPRNIENGDRKPGSDTTFDVRDLYAGPTGGGAFDVGAMVNRFLGWRLPDTFGPDCYITFDRERAKANGSWPVGTNLLSASEASAMFAHVLTRPTPAAAADEHPLLVMTGYQLRAAAEFVNPDPGDTDQLESDVCIQWGPERDDGEGGKEPAGLRVWLADYPGEGSMALDPDKPWPPQVVAASPAAAAGPDVLFDGYAVLNAMDERAKTRTSADNVSDVLDAVVRLRHLAVNNAEQSSQIADPALSTAARDVLAERERQKSVEGWTPEHDDEHSGGEMAMAAAAYAAESGGYGYTNALKLWPWSVNYWKPKEARSNLVRAAALILAEIERMDRALLSAGSQGEQHDSSHEAAPQSSVPSASPRSSLLETDESALPREAD